MSRRDLIVIGASAGGVEALRELVRELPADLPAALLVVLHVPAAAVSVLPQILVRSGKLRAAHARHGEPIVAGQIYVAPPDHHLLVHAERILLSRGPRVNGHRPAVDPLFMSAARWRARRVISVVLSGVLDDGSVGTSAVNRAGGTTLAQSPDDALYPQMPANAIELGGASFNKPVAELAPLLVRLVNEEIETETPPGQGPMRPDIEHELDMDEKTSAALLGPASSFTCPDCHGALWELHDAELVRYRCRIGHSYGAETLFAQQSEKIEEAIWAGCRALEESAALAKRLADRALARGSEGIAERYRLLGRRFTDLDIGLPVAELRGAIRNCLANSEDSEQVLECRNRRGKTVACRATVVPLKRLEERGAVVVLEEVKS
jgi:two-component system chemotaxis response regulator CheB